MGGAIMIFFENEDFKLLEEEAVIYIQIKSRGVELSDINMALKGFPRVRIQSFVELQKALTGTIMEKTQIGELKEKIEIEIAKDEMTAYMRLNILKSDIEIEEQKIKNEVIAKLNELEICVGVQTDILKGNFISCKKQVIAEGVAPISGRDAKYKYFKLSEVKPELKEDGKADLYEMNLIDNVNIGDWLGEKKQPLPGIPGQTVTGRELPAKSGRDYQLKFDPKSVLELVEGEIVTLRAKKEGQ